MNVADSPGIREYEVALLTKDDSSLEVRITDPKILAEVAQAVAGARADPQPADYEIVGTMRIVDAQGNEDVVVLFVPWGRYKDGDEYLVADLRMLSEHIRQCVEYAAAHVLPLLDRKSLD